MPRTKFQIPDGQKLEIWCSTNSKVTTINEETTGDLKFSVEGNLLSIPSLSTSTLTAARLLWYDSSKRLVTVGNLGDWVAGTTNQISVNNDGDGTITLALGTVPIANGGTNNTSFTDTYLTSFDGTKLLSSTTIGYAIGTTAGTSDTSLTIAYNAAVTNSIYGSYIDLSSTSSTNGVDKYGLYITCRNTWNGTASRNIGLYINTDDATENIGIFCFTGSIICQGVALATNTTEGFLYIPTCAGTPSGTPVAHTGTVALVFDTTNNKLYVYDGSWISATLA